MAAPETADTASTPADTPPVSVSALPFPERYIRAYRWMILARSFEDKMRSIYHSGQVVGGVFVSKGQEAFSVALPCNLDRARNDVYGPLIRDLAGRLAFCETLLDPARTYLGSAKGPMRGRDGNIHRGNPREGVPAPISHLGALMSVVCGMLVAHRFKGITGSVGATCIGDGASSTGAFHEAMNLAGVEKLPLVVALANNHYAYSTPNNRQFACENLVDRAIGYGFTGHEVDGTDLEASLRTFETAVNNARNDGGPQLVVGSLLRLSGHGEHDDSFYISQEDRDASYGRDCTQVARAQIQERGWATGKDCARWDDDARAQVDQAIATAQKEPGPDPYSETWRAIASTHLVDGFFEPESE